jgi:hypothetical protein
MKIGKWLVGSLLGALLLGLACAPVDGPAPAVPDGDEAAEAAPLPVPAVPPAKTEKQAIPSALGERIKAAVENVRRRDLTTHNAFWTVFHGILGLGPGVELVDPGTGERVKAIDHIFAGKTLRGLIFRATAAGLDVVTTGDTLGQGHQDQFVAEMGQWGMPADRKVRVGGRDYTFMDFVRHSQMRARITANQELSWAVIVVGQYIGTDVSWTNDHHEKLHYEDLIRYELAAPVETAACGGTHRLFGLSWSYHLYLQRGGKTAGVWKEVAEKTARYKQQARRMQNGDGTFSTSFFRERASANDRNLRINTTGHILEWLALALSDDELRRPWVQAAASALALEILSLRSDPIDSGSMYHAVHGLLIYYARMFDRSFCPKELLVPLPPGWKKV